MEDLVVIIPMAGEGKRFKVEGYTVHKPAIQTTYHKDGIKRPMAVCAAMDLPFCDKEGANLIYIVRDFHHKDGVVDEIQKFFPFAKFVTLDHLTNGQATTCLNAFNQFNSESFLIGGCDNGMILDDRKLSKLKLDNDVIIFTYRNHYHVIENPKAYGYVKTEGNVAREVTVKDTISETPEKDHAIVSSFWFRSKDVYLKS
jgi:hypothetical protein